MFVFMLLIDKILQQRQNQQLLVYVANRSDFICHAVLAAELLACVFNWAVIVL